MQFFHYYKHKTNLQTLQAVNSRKTFLETLQKIAQQSFERKEKQINLSSWHIKPLSIFRHFRLFSFWYSGEIFLISPEKSSYSFVRKCRDIKFHRDIYFASCLVKRMKITERDLFNIEEKQGGIEKERKGGIWKWKIDRYKFTFWLWANSDLIFHFISTERG